MREKSLYIFVVLFLLCQSLSLYTETEPGVMGIVFSVKGTIIIKNNDQEEVLKPGEKIYQTSSIHLAPGTKKGKIQLLTSQGPVIYSRFPVTFEKNMFASLSNTQQDNYIASIGGTVLSGRGAEGNKVFLGEEDDIGDSCGFGTELFEWKTNIGVLTEKNIKDGFSLVLSKTKNSKENASLFPLYFKIKEQIDIKEISFEIIKDNTFVTVYEKGFFKKIDDGLLFVFDCFQYEVDTPYIVEIAVTVSGDDTDYFEFGYVVAGNNKVKEIESEISRRYSGKESDFEKDLIKSRVYWEYNMKLNALAILKSLELDIEDLL